MKNKKVLIMYATYGSGHKTVANYLYDYFTTHGNYEVKIIDVMNYENIIGKISKKAFEQNFKHKINSIIFSIIYEIFDTKVATLPYKPITKSIFKNKKLHQEIIDFNPDLVISSHFFGNIVVSSLNDKGLTNAKMISIITDYASHEMWLKEEEKLDAIIVSNDIVKNELIDKGVDSKKIYAYGIPISEKFQSITNITTIKEKYNVNNSKKTFLFFSGGSNGSTSAIKYLKRLLAKEYDINVIFVCGKNERAQKKARKLVNKNDYQNVTILGFSKEVNELLSISDVVITKPGGLSVTESLEMKVPMLLIPGAGGQELYNAKFVCKNGYGINCRSPRKLAKSVGIIIKKKHILNNIKNKLNKYHDNKSIEKIYDLSTKILK